MEDSSIVNQLQMMNSSPVSVSQLQQGIQLGGSGHVKHSLMISPKVSVARCISVSRDGFKSNNNSTGADEVCMLTYIDTLPKGTSPPPRFSCLTMNF